MPPTGARSGPAPRTRPLSVAPGSLAAASSPAAAVEVAVAAAVGRPGRGGRRVLGHRLQVGNDPIDLPRAQRVAEARHAARTVRDEPARRRLALPGDRPPVELRAGRLAEGLPHRVVADRAALGEEPAPRELVVRQRGRLREPLHVVDRSLHDRHRVGLLRCQRGAADAGATRPSRREQRTDPAPAHRSPPLRNRVRSIREPSVRTRLHRTGKPFGSVTDHAPPHAADQSSIGRAAAQTYTGIAG